MTDVKWLCPCGAVNPDESTHCYHCKEPTAPLRPGRFQDDKRIDDYVKTLLPDETVKKEDPQ